MLEYADESDETKQFFEKMAVEAQKAITDQQPGEVICLMTERSNF